MTTKNTFQLTALTVVLVVVAFLASRARTDAGAPGEEPLFVPALAESINDVDTVTIQGQDETFTLERASGGWGMQEKGGYPVDGAKIRAYLLALAEAGRVEEKTDDPARYERLGVQDVDAEGSQSTRVTVTSKDGQELADVIVGKMRVSKGGDAGPAYYARTGGEAASWLVDADLQVDGTSKGWLDQEIMQIGRDEVVAVRIEHADGELVSCTKTEPDAQYPELHDVPEGKEPSFPGVTARFTSALDRLRLDDVQKDGTVELPDPPQATATFWTADGLKVTALVSEIETKLYCRFTAEYDEDVPGAEAAAPADPAPGDGEAAPETDEGKTPDEVKKDAAEIQEKVAGWTYLLPTYKKTAFMSRMTELVRDIPEPTPPPTEEPGTLDDGPLEGPADPPADGGDPGPGATDESADESTDDPPTDDPPTDDPPTEETEGGAGTGTEEAGGAQGGGEGGGA